MKRYTIEQLRESPSTFTKYIIECHDNKKELNFKDAFNYYIKNSVHKDRKNDSLGVIKDYRRAFNQYENRFIPPKSYL